MIDALFQLVVVAVAPPDVSVTPTPGQGWILGLSPARAWAGTLAVWATGQGFSLPFVGMTILSERDSTGWRFRSTSRANGIVTGMSPVLDGVHLVGSHPDALAALVGGTVVDVQARTAMSTLIPVVKAHGHTAADYCYGTPGTFDPFVGFVPRSSLHYCGKCDISATKRLISMLAP